MLSNSYQIHSILNRSTISILEITHDNIKRKNDGNEKPS